MSKKHKKYKYFETYDRKSGRKKGGKKGKKSYYDRPKMKTVKPTLSKKEAKENKKIVLSPVDVPKTFTKNRRRCNHADGMLTVQQYKDMTPSWAAYTPALERMVEQYGADHVHVCKHCYDVVVDRDCVSADAVRAALVTLYAAANVAVSNQRMKDDEVKAIAKLKDVIDDFGPVIDALVKIEEDGSENASAVEADTPASLSDLNKNTNTIFVP